MIEDKCHLSHVLDWPLAELEEVARNANRFYYTKKKPKLRKDGSPKLKNGKPQFRIIHPSTGRLKKIQNSVKEKVLAKIPLPPNVMGVEGTNNIMNAKRHQGKKYHLCTDLKDFFPSVTRNKMKKALLECGFSLEVSELLTKLITYRGKVPQGAPTSNHASNIAFLSTDRQLIDYCEQYAIEYTRYVDDLAFSSSTCFKNRQAALFAIVEQGGFRRNHRKTFYKIGPVPITGVTAENNRLTVPDYIIERLGTPNRSPESKEGLRSYIRSVNRANRS